MSELPATTRDVLMDGLLDSLADSLRAPIDVVAEPEAAFLVLDRHGVTLTSKDNVCDAKAFCDGNPKANSVVKDGVVLCRKRGPNEYVPEASVEEVA